MIARVFACRLLIIVKIWNKKVLKNKYFFPPDPQLETLYYKFLTVCNEKNFNLMITRKVPRDSIFGFGLFPGFALDQGFSILR